MTAAGFSQLQEKYVIFELKAHGLSESATMIECLYDSLTSSFLGTIIWAIAASSVWEGKWSTSLDKVHARFIGFILQAVIVLLHKYVNSQKRNEAM